MRFYPTPDANRVLGAIAENINLCHLCYHKVSGSTPSDRMSLLHPSGAFDNVGNVRAPRCTIVRVHPLM